MATRVIARTNLTDLIDSSAMKQILAAFAREIDDVYFQLTRLNDLYDLRRAAGDDLDARAKEIQPGTLRRLGALKAIGQIVFSRSSNTLTTITIPAGTVVKTADGVSFTTTEQTQITATSPQQIAGHGVGRDSSAVSATANTAGVAGNVGTGAVVAFSSKPPGITEVTNVTAFSQGREIETDDEFRARILDYVASLSRCTVEALEFLVLNVTDDVSGKRVVFSHVFEDPIDRGNVIIYIDDGAGTAATFGTAIVNEIVLALALGGEEFLFVDSKPIAMSQGFTLTLKRGVTTYALISGTDYYVNPASGLLFVPAPGLGGIIAGDEIRASYTPFTGLIPVVQKVVDGDPADRLNFPGFRAAGVLVRVLAPQVVSFSITAVFTILDGFDHDTVVDAAETAVQDYVNNLGISGDVIRSELIERIMEVDGVYDVNLTAPAGNITILDDQIARIAIANINIS
jgi:uncharacterized phage protein gp47/JayE